MLFFHGIIYIYIYNVQQPFKPQPYFTTKFWVKATYKLTKIVRLIKVQSIKAH